MATYTAKFSQDVLSAISSHNQNSESTLSGVFNALMNVNNTLARSYSYSNTWRSSSGSLIQYFNDGSQLQFYGTANVQTSGYGYESGTAVATTRILNVPSFGTETISGTLNYNYAVQNGYLAYLYAGGNVRSYRLDLDSMVDLGKGYIQVNGNMNLSSSGNVSGSLTSFSQGGSKLLISQTISGAFNVSGNVTSSASVTGTMTGWNEQYYDGSYDSFSGSRYIGPTTNIAAPMLADPSLWASDDNFNIELTGNITSSVVINAGDGNDTISFKGGGSTVSINAGAGTNTVSLQNSAALVIASSGNNNITDTSRLSTIVFSGRYSDYSFSFNVSV